ncbi:MAG: NAD-dependent epimerase/dehydratase family protein, partial [Candidatus Thermoplasmatota archaeon]|nr:NAD-dependent epimerase/dehydratase family protein [Candidatus Thermoplasmatota archaeon]
VNSDTHGQLVDETYRYDGEHLTAYDRTKWQAHWEEAVPRIQDGLPLTIVMPGVVYGPGDTSALAQLWRDHLQGKLPAIPRRTAYCWGHVEDIARAHVQALERGKPQETYIIAGEKHALTRIMELAAEITGRDAPRTLPPWVFQAMAGVSSLINRVTDLPEGYDPETLRVMAGTTYLGDNAKAVTELGLEHRPIEEGLRETLAWEAEQLGIQLPTTAPV